jgi:hypothetical protein
VLRKNTAQAATNPMRANPCGAQRVGCIPYFFPERAEKSTTANATTRDVLLGASMMRVSCVAKCDSIFIDASLFTVRALPHSSSDWSACEACRVL